MNTIFSLRFIIPVWLFFVVSIPASVNGRCLSHVNNQPGAGSQAAIRFPADSDTLQEFYLKIPVGFASVSGDGFAGPVTGGGNIQGSDNTLYINGPTDFEKLVLLLYDRKKAYKNKADNKSARYAIPKYFHPR